MERKQLQKKYGIIGESPALKQALDKVLQVAPTDITVLLNGETGVGKDITARAIHEASLRKSKNLVIVNCGAIPEGIIESELFGHEKGAYTGAHESRMGYFEQADGGTIFLDEITDTPQNVQVKLLRVLETGEFFRVGSSKMRKVNVRVIAASNKEMWESVERGNFREDLYYRLNTITIRIPPLRERNEDILLLFSEFVSQFAKKYDSVFRGMSDGARSLLLSYRWPGNIRELRNVAEQLVILEKSQFVDEEVLKKYLKGRQKLGSPDNLPILFGQYDAEKELLHPPSGKDTEEMYRAILDLKNYVNEIKKMMGAFFYHSLPNKEIPFSLPPASGRDHHGSEAKTEPDKPFDLHFDSAPFSEYQVEEEEKDQSDHFSPDAKKRRESGAFTPDFSPEEADAPEARAVSGEEDRHIQLKPEQKKALKLFGRKDLPSVEEMERFLVEQALEKYQGNRRRAARVLGMSERTLYRKIEQFNLSS